MNIDPYEALGVDKAATDTEIKKAYRKLAAKHHPDRGGNEKTFKEINEAYSRISTEEKRYEYEHSQSNPFGGFEDIFGGFGDIFENLFGGNHQRRSFKETSDDEITFDFRISLSQIKNGITQVLNFERNIKCSPCNGLGGKHRQVCPACQGRGVVTTRMGPMVQQTSCHTCLGTGSSFKERCSSCSGTGIVKTRDRVTMKIGQKQ